MKDIHFQFGCVEELEELLHVDEDEREIDLPLCADGLMDGQWVLATFSVGECSTSVAGCVMDRGVGLGLAFTERDWVKLNEFCEESSTRESPPSMRCPPITETVSTAGTRILVVDGESETRVVTERLLEGAGYEVTATSSAEQAFEQLRGQPVDLIVCEWSLPGMSGLEFCRQLRHDAALRNLPLVFLTTHASQRRVMEAYRSGVDEYMTKPFREPELSARVIGLLRRAHSREH